MRREVTSADELRAIVGQPTAAVAKKVTDRLSEAQQVWLKQSPLGFVATTDADGRVDVSPKGDPPGFVQIIDDTTIAIPERPGNCLLYTSPSPRDGLLSRMPSSA